MQVIKNYKKCISDFFILSTASKTEQYNDRRIQWMTLTGLKRVLVTWKIEQEYPKCNRDINKEERTVEKYERHREHSEKSKIPGLHLNLALPFTSCVPLSRLRNLLPPHFPRL